MKFDNDVDKENEEQRNRRGRIQRKRRTRRERKYEDVDKEKDEDVDKEKDEDVDKEKDEDVDKEKDEDVVKEKDDTILLTLNQDKYYGCNFELFAEKNTLAVWLAVEKESKEVGIENRCTIHLDVQHFLRLHKEKANKLEAVLN
uniref:Uncharacterized protein n=1 Tax=Glossina pallidipes TaxID=7398 RepID=A0A1A9ZPK8_GLOPL